MDSNVNIYKITYKVIHNKEKQKYLSKFTHSVKG